MNVERVVLTTGGTGGHIFPALAVAEEIKKRNPNAMILFMGGKYGQEADLAVKAGLDFAGLPVRGIIGRGLKGFFAIFNMIRSLAKAIVIMRKIKPQLVVGFGGYAAFPGLLAAKFLKIPSAIHEQNAIPGKANLVMSKYAKKIFLSIPDKTNAFDANKTFLTGNPVRESVQKLYSNNKLNLEDELSNSIDPLELSAEDSAGLNNFKVADENKDFAINCSLDSGRPRRLLIMGGSLGAHPINAGVINSLPIFLESNIEIWHQTGILEYEKVREAYRMNKAEHVRVDAFIDDMNMAYSWADLVLCRAGGSTIAELLVAGLPSILIPFPHAAHNHQYYNAKVLEDSNAAIVLEQKEFFGVGKEPHVLSDAVFSIINDKDKCKLMGANARKLSYPHAAINIVSKLEELIEK